MRIKTYTQGRIKMARLMTDLAKSDDDKSSSSSDEADENLFKENLEQLAASGELDTVDGVKQAYLNTFGENLLVSGDFV
jgi:hypothetical protein